MAEVLTETNPNYDCRETGLCPMCGENHADVTRRRNEERALAAERERLEREVIEAVKILRAARKQIADAKFASFAEGFRRAGRLATALDDAGANVDQKVDALLEFESKNNSE